MKTSNRPQNSRSRRKLRRDLKTLTLFTAIYCDKHHAGPKQSLHTGDLPAAAPDAGRYRYCADCRALLRYAFDRRLRCPLDPKPACRNCPHPCYAPRQRSAMRRIMAFSGPYLIRRGRFDLLWRLHVG